MPIREIWTGCDLVELLALSLQSGSDSENRELARISRGFQGITRGILWISDCVAEGEGFELSVRFWAAKPRRVRKLQRGKPEQRISYQNSPRKPSPPSGFDSPSIRNVKANARRSCCKWSRGECYCPTWLTPDCLPSGQFHRREGLSLPLRLIFFPKVCLEQFAGSPHAFLRHHNRFCFAPRVLGLW